MISKWQFRNQARQGFLIGTFNRRKDVDTGSDKHLITSELAFTIAADIDREKSVMSWRGYRHMFGLRVRGQHTRTTGRKGGAVGVKKVGKITPEGTAPGTENRSRIDYSTNTCAS